jgi:hypothetical protein
MGKDQVRGDMAGMPARLNRCARDGFLMGQRILAGSEKPIGGFPVELIRYPG